MLAAAALLALTGALALPAAAQSVSTDATLSALSLGTGVTLSPTFASATMEGYRAWVANSVSSVMVTATKNDNGASVAIAGTTSTTGTETINLSVGANKIDIVVTAQDGTTNETYKVTIVREAAVPTADPTALMTANLTVGQDDGSGTRIDHYGYSVTQVGGQRYGALASTETSSGRPVIPYNGTNHPLTDVEVAGPEGVGFQNQVSACIPGTGGDNIAVVQSWILHLDNQQFAFADASLVGTCHTWARPSDLSWEYGDIVLVKVVSTDATLSALSLGTGVTLSPTFASATMEGYRAWVANSVSTVTVTATRKNNGAAVAIAGTTSTTGTETINLSVGANKIDIVVTAEDGTNETYKVTIVREAAVPTADPTALMTANLTVGQDDGSGTRIDHYGYSVTQVGGQRYGALASTETSSGRPVIPYNGTNHPLTDVEVAGPEGVGFQNQVSACIPGTVGDNIAVVQSWILHLDNQQFAFADASLVGTCHTWARPSDLSWEYGDIVLVKVVSVTAPGAPTNLTAEADGGTRIALSWDAPAADGGSAITGYRIEVSDDGGSSWEELVADTGNDDTSYTHEGLSPGDTRHYRVSAITAHGRSEPSDSAEETTGDPPALSSAEVPSQVTLVLNLDFSENLHGLSSELPASISAAFTVTADGVEREISLIRSGNTRLVFLFVSGTVIYQGQDVVVSYDKTVAGSEAIADSDGDEVASFTTGVADVPAVVNNSTQMAPLPAPTGFSAEAGDGEVTLSWNPPGSGSGVTHHEYRFRTNGSYGNWIEIDDSGPGETNASGFTVTRDIVNGTAYTFQLRAGGDDGDSLGVEAGRVTPERPPTGLVPTVTSVVVASAPRSGDTYRLYETLLFTVTFSEPVELKPHGRLRLEVKLDDPGGASGSTVEAVFSRITRSQYPTDDTPQVSRARHMHFEYKVQLFDSDTNGVSIRANALRLGSGARIRSEGAVDAELDHAAVDQLSDHKVDGSADVPTIERIEVVSTPRLRWSGSSTTGHLRRGREHPHRGAVRPAGACRGRADDGARGGRPLRVGMRGPLRVGERHGHADVRVSGAGCRL